MGFDCYFNYNMISLDVTWEPYLKAPEKTLLVCILV